jgi:hypothetical protein
MSVRQTHANKPVFFSNEVLRCLVFRPPMIQSSRIEVLSYYGDGLVVIAQKRRPSFCRPGIPGRLPHPAEHGSLREIEAKDLQLTVNAWRAPGRVLDDHAKDQFSQFPAHVSSSCLGPMPREPRPVRLEPCPMPANDGVRFNKNQCPLPSRPEPAQHHPEQPIRNCKSRLGMLPPEDAELLP